MDMDASVCDTAARGRQNLQRPLYKPTNKLKAVKRQGEEEGPNKPRGCCTCKQRRKERAWRTREGEEQAMHMQTINPHLIRADDEEQDDAAELKQKRLKTRTKS
jgi:hypothetical protein